MMLVAGLLALLLTSAATVVALAADAPSVPSDDPGKLVLVLDASGSMGEPASGGVTRIEAAKRALEEVVDDLPDDQAVALRVFGSEVEFADQPGACEDSERVVDLGTDNRAELRAAVDDYEPFGETPTGHALREAGKDLGDSGPRSIILVSDGEPTCDPDPCEVARDLAGDGVDVRIDVVGLSVSGAARDTLECVADAGNGTYYDADDADDIVDSLTTSAARAARPFDFSGTPVQGTSAAGAAPEIGPGQWLDTMPEDGALYYRIPRTEAGSTIHAGLTSRSVPDATAAALRMSIGTVDEEAFCFTDASVGIVLGLRNPVQTVGGSSASRSARDERCASDPELLLKVEHGTGSRRELAGQPLEVAVFEEPPLEDPDAPPAGVEPLERGAWEPMEPSDDARPVVPGSSLASAPVIGDGTWSADVQPGETQVFAVPVDWGQDVQFQLDTRVTKEAAQAATVASRLDLVPVGPLRDGSKVDFYAAEPEDWTSNAFGNIPVGTDFRTGARTQPLAWSNRSGPSPVAGASVAGVRYVQVVYNVRGDEANLPYTLTVRTRGTAGEGAPRYAADTSLPVPEADDVLVDLARAEQESEAQDDADPSSEERSALPLVIGGLALVLVVAGAILLTRRRRRGAKRDEDVDADAGT